MFFLTEDWYFLSHRLCLARACRDLGWDVVVATCVQDHGDKIRDEGFRLLPLRLRRRGRAPWTELSAIFELVKILSRERPDILHQVGLKPVIYGSLAAMLAPPRAVINALAGMGYIFTSANIRLRIARIIIQIFLWLSLRPQSHRLIVQNDDDAQSLTGSRLISPDRLAVIRGSGVDPDEYFYTPEPKISSGDPVIAVVVTRMLRDKGLREIVLAARALKLRNTPVHIKLIGAPDPDNPSSISEITLRQWDREGCVEWLGHRDDIPEIWASAHIAVLPSYREGLPRALLEAGACGRPIVTTNVPGCSDVVDDGETGFTVPPHDWIGLANAIEKLTMSSDLRIEMGKRMREKVVAQFSEAIVVRQTIDLYAVALKENGGNPISADIEGPDH
ncbi:MAG: glycosyltransferase family 4 protein [Rhodospirillaceae bacterium]|jgi:glycosyltransferase involved in cell wall biosynthesis|nr:glycosyltransferase family 4 protein [Rhodospirillaceae bacterium]